MQNRELKRKSSLLAQKCLKEGNVSVMDVADEADTATPADGELDNLMKTIKGVFNFVFILSLFLGASRKRRAFRTPRHVHFLLLKNALEFVNYLFVG